MRLKWTRRALADISALRRYLIDHASSPQAARRMTLRITDSVTLARDFPGIGRQGRCAGTRELVVMGTPYIAVFRVRGDVLEVLSILHAAQAWPPAF